MTISRTVVGINFDSRCESIQCRIGIKQMVPEELLLSPSSV